MLQVGIIDSFLTLVRLGIGHGTANDFQMFTRNSITIEWDKQEALAQQHGLLPIIVDGIAAVRQKSLSPSLPSREGAALNNPPQEMLLEWIGEVMQNYEQWYKLYKQVISEMAALYNGHGYKMMVLKGYACSLDWPKPEHRPCGDIDIWQFGEYKDADKAVASEKSIKVDTSHHHHTVFDWGEFTVENHYDFNNVHHHKSSAELEKIFKELGKDDSHFVKVKSASTGSATKVYLPSPNLHALFLLKHAMTDFAAFYVTLRQLLDWAFHVQKYHDGIDWKWLDGVMEQYHMKEFYNCINAICVEELGFETGIFNGVQFSPALKDRVLEDILDPKFPREEPKNLIMRLVFKYRRWKGNAWKHELCYKESLLSGFWSGVWNHLLKPKSI